MLSKSSSIKQSKNIDLSLTVNDSKIFDFSLSSRESNFSCLSSKLLVFTFFPWVLNIIWEFFWLPRWSDLLVYASIIFLIYFVLLLLSKVEQNNEDITKLVKEITFLEEKINKINENK